MTPAGTPAPQVGEAITTIEGLDALPVGSVVLTSRDRAWIASADIGLGIIWSDGMGSSLGSQGLSNRAPLTVLFRPDVPQPVATDDAVAREATRGLVEEQGVRLLRENRDYWRAVAESRTADLRDLRSAVRDSLGITGPASDDDLTALLATRGPAAPTDGVIAEPVVLPDPADMPPATGTETVRVTVAVDSDELREWAVKHADSGHHGVAHVLYKAAEGIESLTEQYVRQAAEKAWDEGHAEGLIEEEWLDQRPSNPYSAPTTEDTP